MEKLVRDFVNHDLMERFPDILVKYFSVIRLHHLPILVLFQKPWVHA